MAVSNSERIEKLEERNKKIIGQIAKLQQEHKENIGKIEALELAEIKGALKDVHMSPSELIAFIKKSKK